MEIRAVFGLNSSEAFGNANHLHFDRSIGLRKRGRAGLFALWTPKILNPIVTARHRANMGQVGSYFQSGTLPQSNPLPGFANRNNYPYIKALADFDLGVFAGSLGESFPKKAAGPLWNRLRWRLSHVCRIQAGPLSRIAPRSLPKCAADSYRDSGATALHDSERVYRRAR